MAGLELNKIFASVLVAGITAMLAGFIAEETTVSHPIDKDAVAIEGAAEAGGGEAAAQAGPQPILALISAADIAQGEKISKACAACHSFEKGGAVKVGPDLWGVLGRAKGGVPGFAYSDGMKAKGGRWGYEDLNHFLWKPKSFVEGTKMTFVGLKKSEDRAALIAWLRTMSDSPAAPPSQGEIDAEAAELSPPPATAPESGENPGAAAAPTDKTPSQATPPAKPSSVP